LIAATTAATCVEVSVVTSISQADVGEAAAVQVTHLIVIVSHAVNGAESPSETAEGRLLDT